MLICLVHVQVLIIAAMTPEVNGQACTDGWFGENCSLQCHCSHGSTCDENGKCLNDDHCETGFFGPGCQYVDLLWWEASEVNDRTLLDYNNTTCNTQENTNFVDLLLRRRLPFSWFRIETKNSDNLLKFVTKLNTGTPCINEKKFKVSSTVVDVTCDGDIQVKNLLIQGPVASSICSVYISGGRNVALNEPAFQSSNFGNSEIGIASHAVDGKRNRNFKDVHCSQTNSESTTPFWELRYRIPKVLYRVLIYNRDSFMYRLQGFSLETFGKDGKRTSYFKESSKKSLLIYEVIIPTRLPVASLKIKQGNFWEKNDRMLTLCEVETYGDTICPSNTYGLFCREKCSCKKREACSAYTGVCASGCQTGFYGLDCLFRCSDNCVYQLCEQNTGNCLQCPPGLFGTGCNLDCRVGFYGENCTKKCPTFCENNECYKESGVCLACPEHFLGSYCEECKEMYFGNNCAKMCSKYCAYQSCNSETGRCDSCKTGHFGERCQYGSIPSVLLVLGLIIVCITLRILYWGVPILK